MTIKLFSHVPISTVDHSEALTVMARQWVCELSSKKDVAKSVECQLESH